MGDAGDAVPAFGGWLVRVQMVRPIVLWLAGMCAFAAFSAFAQAPAARNPPLVIRSLVGRDLFEFYCASCHGRDGTGNGPVVPALKMPPPDLTLLARHNGGIFPRERVKTSVTNDLNAPTAAHGTSGMPVWGPVFRGLDPNDTLVTVRIDNVVQYLASIQRQ